MIYRERRLARAQRLREWAENREQKSDEDRNRAYDIMESMAPGQPILIGHHSERRHRRELEQRDNLMRRGLEHRQKAEAMRQRADNIEYAAERAIYSDDPDAIEQLEAKLTELEAERDGIKA